MSGFPERSIPHSSLSWYISGGSIVSKLCERSNPLGVRRDGRPRRQTILPLDTNFPKTLIEDRSWLSFSSLTILCGMAVNRLFLTESHSNPTKSPISGGSSVSWLAPRDRSLRAVRLPISGGRRVILAARKSISSRSGSLNISGGRAVSGLRPRDRNLSWASLTISGGSPVS